VVRALAGHLGLQIPQGAVDRVAGRPGRKRRLQVLAAQPVLDVAGDGLERCLHGLRAFVIARIGHALAAADITGFADRTGDHLGFGLGAARDGEAAGDREPFHVDAK
jgi:hypothetical protein